MNKLKIGIVIPKPNDSLAELKRFIIGEAEIFLFPEGFIRSKDLVKTRQIAKANRKWIISGMDDKRSKGKKYETAIVINPSGNIVGEHKKTSITKWEVDHGYSRGDCIETIGTKFGKIGIAICYEIHFPEISRIYGISGAKIIFNPIGTGMWHEQQCTQWNSVARTRASENYAFVVGCSHFNDTIPIAFAYAPGGECLVQSREENRLVTVTLDLGKYEAANFSQRRPELYKPLIKQPKKS